MVRRTLTCSFLESPQSPGSHVGFRSRVEKYKGKRPSRCSADGGAQYHTLWKRAQVEATQSVSKAADNTTDIQHIASYMYLQKIWYETRLDEKCRLIAE